MIPDEWVERGADALEAWYDDMRISFAEGARAVLEAVLPMMPRYEQVGWWNRQSGAMFGMRGHSYPEREEPLFVKVSTPPEASSAVGPSRAEASDRREQEKP